MTSDGTASGWYYWKQGAPAGQNQGPLSWEQLLAEARSGAVTPNDMVWAEQLGDWRPAGQVAGLFAAPPPQMLQTPAPPPPPPPAMPAYGYGSQGVYAPAVAAPHGKSRLLWILIPIVVVIVIGGALGAYFGIWYNRIDDALDSAFEGIFEQAEGEIFLESAGTAGPEPFAGETFVPAGPTSTLAIPTSTTQSPTTTVSAPTTTAGEIGETVALATFAGDSPALYGGSKNKKIADKEGQLDFLEANPDKAAAFCEALNSDPTFRWSGGTQIRPDQLRDYFFELTPMMLTRDIRVTNHGYRNGHPTPRQSVLQAGQLVLVDRYGMPRVRCECGNPLIPPKAVKKKPTYTGKPWPGFDPTTIIVIEQTTVIIDIFVVVDINTGRPFGRPAGSDGSQDGDAPTPGTTSTTGTTEAPDQSTTTTMSSEPIAASELNGEWLGTFTITDLTFDAETAQAAEEQGCSLALIQALQGMPLPLSMDISVDPGGKTGTATMLLDVSSLDTSGTGDVSSEPQTFTFTIDGNTLNFNVSESDTPGSMSGTVARQGPSLVMTGIMIMGDDTFGMEADWELTRTTL